MFKVYEARKFKLGEEHPWTLWALCNLSKINTELGLLQEAENMLVDGIAAGKRNLSDSHLGVLMGCGELARVYTRQGRFDEAEKLHWIQYGSLKTLVGASILILCTVRHVEA